MRNATRTNDQPVATMSDPPGGKLHFGKAVALCESIHRPPQMILVLTFLP